MMNEKSLSFLKDSVQILFFIVIATITLLTYLRAKKTLLQPIRTEIFKEQLKEFSSVLKLFAGKSEIDLRNDFAFDKLVHANTCKLMDTYASLFFNVEINREKRPYGIANCPMSRISAKSLKLCDNYILEGEKKESLNQPNPRTIAAIWSKYTFDDISIPREFAQMEELLNKIMRSPLLPKECLSLLEQYMLTIRQNVAILGELLSECAQELPEKYPNLESLEKASLYWIHNRYNKKFQQLEEKADKITRYLRGHFDIDKILE